MNNSSDPSKNHEEALEKMENEIITRSKSYTLEGCRLRQTARLMAKKDIEIERLKEYQQDGRKEKMENRKLRKEIEDLKHDNEKLTMDSDDDEKWYKAFCKVKEEIEDLKHDNEKLTISGKMMSSGWSKAKEEIDDLEEKIEDRDHLVECRGERIAEADQQLANKDDEIEELVDEVIDVKEENKKLKAELQEIKDHFEWHP